MGLIMLYTIIPGHVVNSLIRVLDYMCSCTFYWTKHELVESLCSEFVNVNNSVDSVMRSEINYILGNFILVVI